MSVEPLLPEPLAWRGIAGGDLDQTRDLAPLVDRLSNRLGDAAVTSSCRRRATCPSGPAPCPGA